jgi:hypothetical protein
MGIEMSTFEAEGTHCHTWIFANLFWSADWQDDPFNCNITALIKKLKYGICGVLVA